MRSADSAYYDFVDRFDMLGVGKDIPLRPATCRKALLALVERQDLTFRVPYPMGFFAKGWTAASTIRTAGWKARRFFTDLTPLRAPVPAPKAARATPASW
jgi:hypothetical protein